MQSLLIDTNAGEIKNTVQCQRWVQESLLIVCGNVVIEN